MTIADKGLPETDLTNAGAVYVGTLWAIVSAFCYGATSVLLRAAAPESDPVLAPFMRSAPVTLYVWITIFSIYARRRDRLFSSLVPPAKYLLPLIVTGVALNVTGNGAFQVALTLSWLGLAVPISQGVNLWSGALVGRIALGEPINRGIVAGIVLLIASLVILTASAGSGPVPIEGGMVTTAIVVAIVAGLSWSAGNAGVRWALLKGLSVEQVLSVTTLSGLVASGLIVLARLGPAGVMATPSVAVLSLLAAGIVNAVGLIAFTKALNLATVTRVNGITAAQVAIATVAGLAIFDEPVTAPLLAGVGLTIIGLVLISQSRGRGR